MATILLVQDDGAVRERVATGLGRAGFHVLEAEDSLEALLRHTLHGPVDALLADNELPVVNGLDLAKALRMVQPDLPVIWLRKAPAHRYQGEHYLEKLLAHLEVALRREPARRSVVLRGGCGCSSLCSRYAERPLRGSQDVRAALRRLRRRHRALLGRLEVSTRALAATIRRSRLLASS